jgi:hypothetical protein
MGVRAAVRLKRNEGFQKDYKQDGGAEDDGSRYDGHYQGDWREI